MTREQFNGISVGESLMCEIFLDWFVPMDVEVTVTGFRPDGVVTVTPVNKDRFGDRTLELHYGALEKI